MNPVPEAVYDAALRLVAGGRSAPDKTLVCEYADRLDLGGGWATVSREILKLAAERGVARECRD